MGPDATNIQLEPRLRRVRAPNPSPMTHTGTNTYIVGRGAVTVIDPGPDLAPHMEAILRALSPEERVAQILVTHAHRDHSPLARRLSAHTGAPVAAAGGHAARRRPVMADLARSGLARGGEGIDADFAPDRVLEDGDSVEAGGEHFVVVATPGHTADHIAFAWNDALFTGDHVMGWASSLVSPPDGDLTAFMASCERLLGRKDRIYHAGHGDPLTDPRTRVAWLMDHRRTRDAQILADLAAHPGSTIGTIARRVYTDTPAALLPAAERNVLAHLIAAAEDGRVRTDGALSASARFFTER